jgi:hypothetical protein
LDRAIEHVATQVLVGQIERFPEFSTHYSVIATFAALGRVDLAIKEAETLPDLWMAEVLTWWQRFQTTGEI